MVSSRPIKALSREPVPKIATTGAGEVTLLLEPWPLFQRTGFDFQHLRGSLQHQFWEIRQPLLAFVGTKYTHGAQTYMQGKYPYT